MPTDGANGQTHAEDLAALQTLADRGLDKAERDRVRKLVELAISAPDIDAILASNEPAQDDVERLAAWYEDWAETARATITDRKDLLFRLGVAKRRKGRPSSEAAPPIATPVVTPAFPPPAPVAVPPANVAPTNGLTNGAAQPTTPAVVIA